MYEIAIIGAGPAGSSAALFTAKAGKSTLVIDSDHSMTKRAWFENFYGIEEISGPDLLTEPSTLLPFPEPTLTLMTK